MKQQINIRVSNMTRRQLDQLVSRMGTSITETITVAIERLAKQELPMNTSFDTKADALKAGFSTAKAGDRVKDTSGPGEFGYAFTEFGENGEPVREAVAVWLRKDKNKMGREGCIVMMFPPSA